MVRIQDALAVPTHKVEPNAFVLYRLNSKWITGRWDPSLLRDIGLQGLILLIVFGVFVFVSPFSIRDSLDELRMQLTPVQTVSGDLANYYTIRCGRNNLSTCYYITYQYIAGDRSYTRTEIVDGSAYARYIAEPRVPVTYAVQDPSAARLGSAEFQIQRMLAGSTLIFIVVLFIIIPVINPLIGWVKIRRYRRRGTLIWGKITQCDGVITGSYKSRRYVVHVTYAFAAPAGTTIFGTASRQRNDLRRRALPESGTPCAVLYVSDQDHLLL